MGESTDEKPVAVTEDEPLLFEEALPDDVLFHILSFLHSANDLNLARRVCKRWAKVGSEHTWRAYSCKRCLTPLFHPSHHVAPIRNNSNAFSGLPDALKPDMADGRTMMVRNLELCNFSVAADEEDVPPEVSWLLHQRGWKSFTSAAQHQQLSKMRILRCPCCEIYLGYTITTLPSQAVEAVEEENAEKGIEPLMVAGMDVNHPSYLLHKGFVCRWFLRLTRADGSPDPWKENTEFYLDVCSGARRKDGTKAPCGNLLFEEDQILSREHLWRAAGAEASEPAFYLNALVAGSVIEGTTRVEDLAQGDMVVCDLFCKECGGSVGWRFLETVAGHRNLAYSCRRQGIVVSSARTYCVTRDGREVDDLAFEDLPAGILRPTVRADRCFPNPRDMRERGTVPWESLQFS